MSDPTSPAVQSLSAIRRVIAERMSDANRTIPHFHVTVEIDVGTALTIREKHSASADPAIGLTAILVKASGLALSSVPEMNIQWSEHGIRRLDTVDVGVVVALDDGMVIPVIRDVARRPISEIAGDLRDMSNRARAKRIKLHELEGGAFTVSNLGMYGVTSFDAIINAPQCSILAVGSATRRLRVDADGGIQTVTEVCATLSADHRAVDGVAAARFLGELRRVIEQPDQLFMSREG